MQHQEITKAIIGCAFEVSNELGSGFLESVYEKAMCIALRQKGLTVYAQHPIRVFFRGICVGSFDADLLVEGVVLVELKATLRSRSFPGLWLLPSALLAADLGALFTVLDVAAATPEHTEFVAMLNRAT